MYMYLYLRLKIQGSEASSKAREDQKKKKKMHTTTLPPIMTTTQEGLQTSQERDKLARRRHELALLHAALRQRIPFHQIPLVLAGLKQPCMSFLALQCWVVKEIRD